MVGDSHKWLAKMPARSVHACVTSPPYYKLKDYDADGQIGHEASIEEYVDSIVSVGKGIARVLRSDGTLWLNIGDSYVGWNREGCSRSKVHASSHLKAKDAALVPFRVALALQSDGWWIRADNIWHKPDAHPENVGDRPNKNHEYVFLLAKAPTYYYDSFAVRQWHKRKTKKFSQHNLRTVWSIPTAHSRHGHPAPFPEQLAELCIKAGTSERGCCPHCGKPWVRELRRVKNKKRPAYDQSKPAAKKVRVTNRQSRGPNGNTDVVQSIGWKPGCPCPEHEPVPCTILDPFAGSGTTGLVATRLGRNANLIELSQGYITTIFRRIETAPLVDAKITIEHLEKQEAPLS